MYRNVMSPTIARRLGACVNSITRNHHTRLSTTSFRAEKAPNDHNNEHLKRLALLQAEDLRLLKPVKAKIRDYQAVLDSSREFLTTLSPSFKPLEGLQFTAHTPVEHRAAIKEALASLDRLKDARLPNLLAQVEDLELEEFPAPSSDETEIDFLQRLAGMTAAEKQDTLDSLNMEIRAVSMQASESIERLRGRWVETNGSEQEPAKPLERKDNPFAKLAAKATVAADAGKKKAEEKGKPKFGMSTDEQFANVIANATPRDKSPKNKVVDKANFGLAESNGDITTWKPIESSKSEKLEPTRKPVETSNPWMPEPQSQSQPRSASVPSDTPPASPRGARASSPRPYPDAPKPKPQGHDLNSLYAQLKTSWKKSATS